MIESAEHIGWLGVHFDTRLTFKHHTTTWCGEAIKAAQYIRRLSLVRRRAASGALVKAVDASIVAVATYESEV